MQSALNIWKYWLNLGGGKRDTNKNTIYLKYFLCREKNLCYLYLSFWMGTPTSAENAVKKKPTYFSQWKCILHHDGAIWKQIYQKQKIYSNNDTYYCKTSTGLVLKSTFVALFFTALVTECRGLSVAVRFQIGFHICKHVFPASVLPCRTGTLFCTKDS